MAEAESELPPELEGYSEGTIEDGTRREVERKWLVDEENETYWWFDIRPVTWAKKNQILTDNVRADDGSEPKLRMEGYYRDVFMAMVQDWSGDDGLLGTFLTGLRDDLGEQVEEWCPDPGPVEAGSEEEEGNSETPSDSPEGS